MRANRAKSRTRARRILVAAVVASVVVAIALGVLAYLRSPGRDLPYKDSFASGTADEWNAFGGTWGIYDGGMRNDSDERGAKLMTGSPYWRNYSVEADVKLLGEDGDAGLIIRAAMWKTALTPTAATTPDCEPATIASRSGGRNMAGGKARPFQSPATSTRSSGITSSCSRTDATSPLQRPISRQEKRRPSP